MGPKSKEALCNAIGHLIDELQQQRATMLHELGEIRALLQQRSEHEQEDLAQINRRLTELERGRAH